eukprot:354584-Chlamydomonas_euryale.AAC.1
MRCGVVWRVVWCGVVWCTWCGVVWGGVVWCGVVWFTWCGVVWCGVGWGGVGWYGVVHVVWGGVTARARGGGARRGVAQPGRCMRVFVCACVERLV